MEDPPETSSDEELSLEELEKYADALLTDFFEKETKRLGIKLPGMFTASNRWRPSGKGLNFLSNSVFSKN
ncbi:MAG TPA: hypothetical protein VJ873_04155 [bacterium]|nr:hypothetical protein [bacterium]